MKIHDFDAMFRCKGFESYNNDNYEQLKSALYSDSNRDIRDAEFGNIILSDSMPQREKVALTFCLYLGYIVKQNADDVICGKRVRIVEGFATALENFAQKNMKTLANATMQKVIRIHMANLSAACNKYGNESSAGPRMVQQIKRLQQILRQAETDAVKKPAQTSEVPKPSVPRATANAQSNGANTGEKMVAQKPAVAPEAPKPSVPQATRNTQPSGTNTAKADSMPSPAPQPVHVNNFYNTYYVYNNIFTDARRSPSSAPRPKADSSFFDPCDSEFFSKHRFDRLTIPSFFPDDLVGDLDQEVDDAISKARASLSHDCKHADEHFWNDFAEIRKKICKNRRKVEKEIKKIEKSSKSQKKHKSKKHKSKKK